MMSPMPAAASRHGPSAPISASASCWPPGARLIGIDWRGIVQDWLDDPPLRIDDVVACEQLADATHRVAQQALIRRLQVRCMFGQDHLDVLADHAFTGQLHAHAHGDSDVWADPHAHMTGRQRHEFLERLAWRTLEQNEHLGRGHAAEFLPARM